MGQALDFETLVDRHRREIQVHCYRMLGSLADAEDLAQETFLRAWKGRDGFEGRASARTWLYRIATNACLDVLARRPRRVLPDQLGPAGEPDGPVAAADRPGALAVDGPGVAALHRAVPDAGDPRQPPARRRRLPAAPR